MNPKTKKWLAGGLVLAVLVLPFGIRAMRGESATGVDIATVAAQPVRPTILASGALAYGTEVNLTAEVVAKVERILVAEGDTVKPGQLLLTLDPESHRNAIERESAGCRQSAIGIERLRANLRLREAQYKRSQALAAQQLVDRNRLEEDRLALETARAELASQSESLRRSQAVLGDAYEQLAKTEIRAPIAGRVVELPIKVGETAIPSTNALAGAKLMKIADTSALLAELKVDEADIAKVEIGQQVDVYPAAYPDTALRGAVEKIALAPTLENQSRAYKVTVRLGDAGAMKLRSGMSARADLYLGTGAKQIAVPVEAVVTESDEKGGEKTFVWAVRDGRARKLPVKTGLSDDRWQAIASGLKAGDRVITGPAKTLRRLAEGEAVEQRKASTADTGEDESRDEESDA
ncbi:MAG: efflux RND transporter periplasmic adaptor subunit [Pseudomonadota bacterium]